MIPRVGIPGGTQFDIFYPLRLEPELFRYLEVVVPGKPAICKE
jgi:hypothetical protein